MFVLIFPSLIAIKNRVFIKESLSACIEKLSGMGLEVPDDYHYLVATILNSCDFEIEKATSAIMKGKFELHFILFLVLYPLNL